MLFDRMIVDKLTLVLTFFKPTVFVLISLLYLRKCSLKAILIFKNIFIHIEIDCYQYFSKET